MGNIKINSVYRARGAVEKSIEKMGVCKIDFGEKMFFLIKFIQQYLNSANINAQFTNNNEKRCVHLPIPECFILDDEEIDKVSQLIF